jgi:hypothetical protein
MYEVGFALEPYPQDFVPMAPEADAWAEGVWARHGVLQARDRIDDTKAITEKGRKKW